MKFVYFFGDGKADGDASMRDLLGGKGANLAEMVRLGIPVPPGFTITTEVCRFFYKNNGRLPEGLEDEVREGIRKVEEIMGRRFGDPASPLLFSVRSGARVSMPGMMDTVLNLGLNDETVEGLSKISGNERFAYDCYRRFIHMYSDVVLGLKPRSERERDPFEEIMDRYKEEKGKKSDLDLDSEDIKEIVALYKDLVKKRLSMEFPQDPYEQLWEAIKAVFRSWNNERAIVYRKLNGIPDDWGTACNIQAMVFGNLGNDSGTGVAFTRNPATGENEFFGEYLINAQGEDVVAGIRTPLPISKSQGDGSLEEVMPDVYKQLLDVREKLEKHYKDMQDIEFTVERRKLWLLQTRSGKRTALAAVRIAVDMVEEGLISEEEAIMRIEPDQLNQLLQPMFDPNEKEKAEKEGRVIAKGLNAGPGAATGIICFDAETAINLSKDGKDVILVRIETSPEDIKGMAASKGILTARGGMTSHAALVARQMGKVCVVGCEDLKIDYTRGIIEVAGEILKEGDYISLDGYTGEVIKGKVETVPSEVVRVLIEGSLKPEESIIYQKFEKLMKWSDNFRRLGIRTNADRPIQAKQAVSFGAEGIGLCRTEHMFFEGDRIIAMREMILADDEEGRRRALEKLLPMQREDFKEIFLEMGDRPVTIRTLDPPLHEFLPNTDKEIEELANTLGVSVEKVRKRVESLKEANPMLGHRGCRLGITYPEITEMQARAIFEAACEVKKEKGIEVKPEVMIPLVGHVKELENQRMIIDRVAREVFDKYGVEVEYKVGTMIEVPRGALTADEIASVADFFSFGTNDLTQTTYGISRDDIGKFLDTYLEKGIWGWDPFAKLDSDGVGLLIKIALEKGRKANKNLKAGICGEHGGEPSSIKFCHSVGLDYVSCSPFRIPIAKLAAAQASIEEKKGL